MSGGERCPRGSVCSSPSPTSCFPRSGSFRSGLNPQRWCGPSFGPGGGGCLGSGSNWATENHALQRWSSVTSHRTNQLSHFFSLSLFFFFFSSLVCSGIHFLVFNFILKFIFTANVHVGIMVNICYFYCYYCFL